MRAIFCGASPRPWCWRRRRSQWPISAAGCFWASARWRRASSFGNGRRSCFAASTLRIFVPGRSGLAGGDGADLGGAGRRRYRHDRHRRDAGGWCVGGLAEAQSRFKSCRLGCGRRCLCRYWRCLRLRLLRADPQLGFVGAGFPVRNRLGNRHFRLFGRPSGRRAIALAGVSARKRPGRARLAALSGGLPPALAVAYASVGMASGRGGESGIGAFNCCARR